MRQLRNKLIGQEISGQDGFFTASLYSAFQVKEQDLNWLRQNISYVNKNFDALFLNYRSDEKREGVKEKDLSFLSSLTIPKVLVVTNAQASALPKDPLLDLFDLVFKREHYIDLDRYPVSNRNKEKIRNTMLGCPLIRVTTKNVSKVVPANLGFKTPGTTFSQDIFFSGKTTHPIRLSAWERLQKEGFNLIGGLNPHKRYDTPIPPELCAPRFSHQQYIQAIRSSQISLALEGYGEYTFRHNEILFLCSFMISTPSIRGLKLPIDLVENAHYICFEDLDDLVDKVRYYREHETERKRIAQAGREQFEKDYDFQKHGCYIKQTISC